MLRQGRKQRHTPLTRQTVQILTVWSDERGSHSDQPLFPTRNGTSLSRDAIAPLVAKHAATRGAMASRLSEVPLRVGNSGWSLWLPRSSDQTVRICTVWRVSGV